MMALMARGERKRVRPLQETGASHLDGNQAKLTRASSYLISLIERRLSSPRFRDGDHTQPRSTSQSEVRDEVPAFCTIRIRPAYSDLPAIHRTKFLAQPAHSRYQQKLDGPQETLNVSTLDAIHQQDFRIGYLHFDFVNHITYLEDPSDRSPRSPTCQARIGSINSTYTSYVQASKIL